MIRDRSRLKNFMKKFTKTVRFGNDHFGAIMGYGDYVIGDSVISRVYYVEGLGHNLFSVRQFCDYDLEVAFRKHSPTPSFLTPGQISSGLRPNPVPASPYVPLTNKELEILFQSMFDEYLEPPRVEIPVSSATTVLVPVISTVTPSSTTIDQDAPFPNNPFTHADNNPFINVFALEHNSEASSSGDASSAESTYVTQPHHHLRKWSKDHPLDNIISNPSRPISTRKQLATDALWCLYNFVLLKVEPKNFKSTVTEDCWFQAI
ncbi:hypothetical protein Tco_0665999 [Tanacetum coccineum]